MTCSNHTPITQLLKELPLAPIDVRQFILKKAKGYIIIDRAKGVAICTSCETEIDLFTEPPFGEKIEKLYNSFEYKHNGTGMCPYCQRYSKVKSVGMGRKKLTEWHRILIPVAVKTTTYITFTEVKVDFTGWNPKLYTWLSAVYKISDGELTYYKHKPESYFNAETWELRKNFKLPMPWAPFGHTRNETKWRDYMYHYKDKKIASCQQLRYFDVKKIIKKWEWDPYLFVALIGQAYKYPAIEMLYKAGFEMLVKDRLEGVRSQEINIRGKNLPRIFKSDMRTVRDLRQIGDIDTEEVEMYKQCLREFKYRINDRNELMTLTGFIRSLSWSQYRDEIKAKINIKKTIEYLDVYELQQYEYVDYLIQLVELKMDLKTKNLFPQNFEAKHRELSERIKYIKNEELRKEMAKIIALKVEKKITEVNEYLFIVAETPEELYLEGETQHHCVAGYADKVARGHCLIYFVRQKEKPEQSYFTLELSPVGEIVQLRGFANCNPPEEVIVAAKIFVEKFKEKIKSRKTA